MSFGPLLFAAPLALLGLIALPVLFWLLRVTPPRPQEVELPSLALLDGLTVPEETPAKTPWWIILLRLLAAALAIFGLAQPAYDPSGQDSVAPGPVLLVIDDGWPSANRWSEVQRSAINMLDELDRDQAVHVLFTAPRILHAPVENRLSVQQAKRTIRSAEPVPWLPDRDDAASRLDALDLEIGKVFWISDNENHGNLTALTSKLSDLGPVTVQPLKPVGATAITAVSTSPEGARIDVTRHISSDELTAYVTAESSEGTPIATTEISFDIGERATEAVFALPAAALNRTARFRLANRDSAGAVWLWDSASKRQRVGIVSAGSSAQPLLSDIYYVRKALDPFADLIEGTLAELVETKPDAIILTDVGHLPTDQVELLEGWISEGGALIRFAGERLAIQADRLTPTPLRQSSRALGGVLAWEQPQPITSVSQTSPFNGIALPEDAFVSRQVLAQPSADLGSKTWASLADGTPLVTADIRDQGIVILFHVTAGPEWSDLPYTGAYVEMLRRAIVSGRGQTRSVTKDGSFVPTRRLDAFGRLNAPETDDSPIDAADFARAEPAPRRPPGIYEGSGSVLTLNAGRRYDSKPIESWPAGISPVTEAATERQSLAGLALTLAGCLLLIDVLVALFTSGLFRRQSLTASAGALGLAVLILSPLDGTAHAQDGTDAAALQMRFAYVETGNIVVDDTTKAGLLGLSRIMFTRTSVEPGQPQGVDLEADPLELYPLIFLAVPDNQFTLSAKARQAVDRYLRHGGALIVDTREATGVAGLGQAAPNLRSILEGIDAPPLRPVTGDHVLKRSFYLVDGFPGRYGSRPLWIEDTVNNATASSGDGVSGLFITDADLTAAWAVDQYGRPLYSVDGGDREREMSYRAGVNLVMYILTGNYKEDQVHIPALLERLGREDETAPVDAGSDMEVIDLLESIETERGRE